MKPIGYYKKWKKYVNLPEALAPPNGCCPTTDPVDLSFMYKFPALCRNMSQASSTTSLKNSIKPIHTSNHCATRSNEAGTHTI